jgi:hypothetical protein
MATECRVKSAHKTREDITVLKEGPQLTCLSPDD